MREDTSRLSFSSPAVGMPGARSTFSIIPPARRKEQSSRSAFFPHSLVSHTFRVTSP